MPRSLSSCPALQDGDSLWHPEACAPNSAHRSGERRNPEISWGGVSLPTEHTLSQGPLGEDTQTQQDTGLREYYNHPP